MVGVSQWDSNKMCIRDRYNTIWAVIFPIVGWPFGVFLMKQFSEGIPTEMLEAEMCIRDRYYMADEHSRVPEVQLASGRTWDALPEEYRQILQACARASAQYERQLWAQEETAARKAALAGGCIELPLPEEEMQNFRQLVQPLYRKHCADYLPLVEEIQAE